MNQDAEGRAPLGLSSESKVSFLWPVGNKFHQKTLKLLLLLLSQNRDLKFKLPSTRSEYLERGHFQGLSFKSKDK